MDSDSRQVWLSIGSNHADADRFVAEAARRLQTILSSWKMCAPYTTPAINGIDPDYLNAVAVGYWSGDEELLNDICKKIESEMGRSHDKSHHTVEIDIDVVCFDEKVVRPVDFSREYFARGFKALSGDC
ncbi:MAG: 2-amino-4-hydroxy-6-hydroxymethyldihydropteridine diphosphokinase [Paramuribaculum sp.]|nr:2-amino-4-hydroxy-6-hydroxymethyldihydropteridine diphosphokinase [Paramuribaculum sp.]